MASHLVNKTLCIVGASGYTGQAIAKTAIKQGINVLAVSRSMQITDPELLKLQQENPSAYKTVRGDANDPATFAEALKNADAIVHTVGTLIDSSITKGRTPGEPGTYEHLNRDCLINVAKYLEQNNLKKKVVYLSASGAPPFTPRYLSTKEEAEDYLLESKFLETTILKPGFIYSREARIWSAFLRWEIDVWSCGFGQFYKKCVPKNTYMHDILGNFVVDRSVRLEDISSAAVYAAFNKELNQQKLYNADIEKNAMYLNLGVARTQEEVQANQQAEKSQAERLQKEKLAQQQKEAEELKKQQQLEQQQQKEREQQQKLQEQQAEKERLAQQQQQKQSQEQQKKEKSE